MHLSLSAPNADSSGMLSFSRVIGNVEDAELEKEFVKSAVAESETFRSSILRLSLSSPSNVRDSIAFVSSLYKIIGLSIGVPFHVTG